MSRLSRLISEISLTRERNPTSTTRSNENRNQLPVAEVVPVSSEPDHHSISEPITRVTLLGSNFAVDDLVRVKNPKPFQPSEGVVVGATSTYIRVRGGNTTISRAPKNKRLIPRFQPSTR